MKKLTLIAALLVAFTASIVTSCRVAPSDWDLDAQWQLMSAEYADTTIVPEPRAYWSFYRHTAQLSTSEGTSVLANLTYVADKTLTLDFARSTAGELEPYGILFPDSVDPGTTPVTVSFNVNELSGKRLVLTEQTTGAVFTFRKF